MSSKDKNFPNACSFGKENAVGSNPVPPIHFVVGGFGCA
jgi:hypothetical protein